MTGGDIPNQSGTISSSGWGNPIRDRVCSAFVNVAERDLLIPTPEDGQLCFVAELNSLFRYGAGRWWRQQTAQKALFFGQLMGWSPAQGGVPTRDCPSGVSTTFGVSVDGTAGFYFTPAINVADPASGIGWEIAQTSFATNGGVYGLEAPVSGFYDVRLSSNFTPTVSAGGSKISNIRRDGSTFGGSLCYMKPLGSTVNRYTQSVFKFYAAGQIIDVIEYQSSGSIQQCDAYLGVQLVAPTGDDS